MYGQCFLVLFLLSRSADVVDDFNDKGVCGLQEGFSLLSSFSLLLLVTVLATTLFMNLLLVR